VDERVSGERVVAQLHRELVCGLSVRGDLGPTRGEPQERRPDTLVCDREHRRIVLGLVDELEEERDRLSGGFVGADASEHPQGPRTEGPRRRNVDHRAHACVRASRVPRLEVQKGRLGSSPNDLVLPFRRRELLRAVEQECGRPGGAPGACAMCSILENGGYARVRLGDARRELPCSGLGILQ
jgi:hypothetical protein